MTISAPSLPTHWLRAWKRPGTALNERRTAIARQWESPLQLLLVAALAGGLALVVPLIVVALALTTSPLWGLLLVPCLAAWVGMVNEFRTHRPDRATEEPAPQEEAKPAARKPAAATRRRTTQASSSRKPRSTEA